MNVCKSTERFIICCEYYDPDELQRNVKEINSENVERHIKNSQMKVLISFREYSQIQKKYQIRKKLLNTKEHNGIFYQLSRITGMRRLAKEVKNRGLVAKEESMDMNRENDQIIEDIMR